ncbi:MULTISPECIES: hypothetical protein [unclassified Pseudomonas]|uniref:hypothetical protein n=1 Tax=unclassified Pseudomonas TaxID=196821 RepID=UPI0035C0E653
MQQPEQGATIFHLQVAPHRHFSDKTAFLLQKAAAAALSYKKTHRKRPFLA